ncbi:ABC transporter substrate-binding protein (plasmid) [Agrobacterium leguminum]|uniref:ABC transporter substrate-binding protein n=1 Tax=Agrobacterium deltaense NCPPB 1641 TaxID=1183425 RepID=A0A1S7UB62_9HYPH|nr:MULTISPECIES: ABC transporter substrate-binding protein [Agrobacterium]WFS69735.1 ABC transporter substrate-binding protein [Agrobacterium leguminum]CVI64039.1 putative ABC transporter substrate-binding protein [Agrobacterium deltaense NCPPB 1641]
MGKSFEISRRQLLQTGVGAGLVAAGGGLFVPAIAQSRTLKIGYVTPQSGPLTLFGEADGFIVGGIREAFKNGLTVGGKTYPLEIVVKDTQSNANRASEVTNELISNDKVDIVVVASAPETVNPVSDQCELNGVPCISSIAPWQPWIFGRGSTPDKGFASTFHFFWGFEDIMAVFANMWDTIDTNKQVGGIFPNDEDGRAWGDTEKGAPGLLSKRGYNVTPSGYYQNLSDDFTAVISAFKKADCQMITGAPIPPDFTTFWTQARQQGFRPKAATVAKAILFPAAVEALGDAGHNLSCEIWWSPNHPFASSITCAKAGQLAEAYTSATKRQWTQPIGFIHALFEVASDALKRTADVDSPQALAEAIGKTSLDTIVGKVDFAASGIKNVAKTPLVGGQWRLKEGSGNKYDLVITSNATSPNIPASGETQPLS